MSVPQEPKMSLPQRPGAREDNFGFLRLAAAIAVLFGHAFPLTGTVAPGLMSNGVQTLAVKVFFVISGYLITQSWLHDPHALRYLLRRVLRIFPGLIVLILLTIVVVGPVLTCSDVVTYFASPSTFSYLSNIIMKPRYDLPGMFKDNIYPAAVNGSLWTIPVEFMMYISMPLVVVFARITNIIFVLVFTLILCFAGIYYVRVIEVDPPIVIYGSSLTSALELAPYFFIGASAKLFLKETYFNTQLAMAMMMAAPFLGWSAASSEALLYIVLPYAILSFGLASSPFFAAIGRHGEFSYGIYLYGFLVQQATVVVFATDGNPYYNFLLAVAPTFVLGWLSWHFVEKPMLSLKDRLRRFNRKRQLAFTL